MLNHTKSFKILKIEQQKILDFSVLVCYAIPNLKKSIKGFKENIINYESFVKPDYFIDTFDINKVEYLTKNYKKNLGKYLLLSAFSFFESYIKDVVLELIDFHGGVDIFTSRLHERHKDMLNNESIEINNYKRKLQEPAKKNKKEKYKKYIKKLNEQPNYRHPSELLATYGLKHFIENVTGVQFKSYFIPDLLEYAFCMNLSDKINTHPDLMDKNLRETFDIMRELRNNIGHGNTTDIGFEKVMDFIRFQRHLAVKIEEHLLNYFFILEDIQ